MDYRIEELRVVLREDPTSRQFFQLGEMLRREGELADSAAVLRAGLEHHPRYVAAWVSLGRALAELGSPAEAAEAFAKALEIDPGNAVAARNLGRATAARGDWEEALKAFSLAVQLVPGDEGLEGELAEARRHAAPEEAQPEVEAAGVTFSRPEILFSMSESDPFEVQPRGDTGIWAVADEVFGGPGEPSEAARPAPAEMPVAAAEGVEAEEPAMDLEEPTGVPLPTVTLARLALEQRDWDLAERTARAVLEANPGSVEARTILEAAQRRAAPGGAVDRASLDARKIDALRGWLNAVKLASESRTL